MSDCFNPHDVFLQKGLPCKIRDYHLSVVMLAFDPNLIFQDYYL